MIRLDRIATLCFAQPLMRALTHAQNARLPILMYHGIRERLDGRRPYYETSTTPAVFARHMQFLKDEGYQALDLSKAVSKLSAGESFGKQVVITFDDGYRDFYTHAFPVLQRHNFRAALFLPSARIGNQRICLGGNEYLTWAEVRDLNAHGIAIASHTVTHPELRNLSDHEIDREVGESKQTIEDKLGAAVVSFAYPYAFPEGNRLFSSRLAAMLEKHGYENGVTTILGTARARSPRYFLPRLPVNSWDDLRFLKAKLEGAYDWLHIPQLLTKAVEGFTRSQQRNEGTHQEAPQ